MNTPPPQTVRIDDVLIAQPDHIRVRLFQNVQPLPGQVTLADFQEATFNGYAPTQPTLLQTPKRQSSPGQAVREMSVDFRVKGEGEPQTVTGWFATVQNAEGVDVLIAADRLQAPEVMAPVGKLLRLFIGLFVFQRNGNE